MYVVIPAYQPTPLLPELVTSLVEARPAIEVLVVDDGSDTACAPVFAACEAAGARVLRLSVNRGKGAALRAAFTHLRDVRASGPVVTADADGQHAVADVLAVADAVDETPGAARHLVLGQRDLEGDVPLRSRFGNGVTRMMFRAATGRRLLDTQTGLRGVPSSLLPWLTTLRGDRYEYELVMLLQAARHRIDLRSVPIRTIYLDDNASSHFRPVADSVRIYAPLLTFVGTSLAGFVVDTVLLMGLHALLGVLLPAVVLARVASASLNFTLNRRLVFPDGDGTDGTDGTGGTGGERRWSAAGRYAGLAAGLLAANYLLLATLYAAGMPLLAAKLVTELVLVTTSYVVQARFVFAHRRRAETVPAHTAARW
ncbi:glycosyltransferase [Nocardioides sp.]|uniref:glycosyltransferase n=1 Tax=Nocardioides sp. TaxID=35761 RepID=UPI002719C40E|nr:glycosyltransferase [Nocardioides sp.]MDO9457847.1 glycosyltransferase [Nocardioides sp.]